MKKFSLLLLIVLFAFSATQAQKKKAKNGKSTLFSHTSAEDIRAESNSVTSSLNAVTGKMVFVIPVQSYKFKRRLMQKHFNQPRFMDSKKHPKIKFVGKITNLREVNFVKDGKYNVTVEGKMTIRGVTKPQTAKGVFTVENGVIKGYSKFVVKGIGAYGVGKPKNKSKKNSIADNIECQVWVTYK
jgi:polyisoprenoid-binding protein YceI